MVLRSDVELSEFRVEIDEFLLEGKSGRFVSEWLKSQGENISHVSINKYKNKHLDIEKEATIQYNDKQSKKRKQKKVQKVVSSLDALDDIIEEGNKIKLEVNDLRPDYESGVTDIDIENVKVRAKRLVIQAAKAKHDITKDEPTPVNVNILGAEFDRIMDEGLEEIEDDNDVED